MSEQVQEIDEMANAATVTFVWKPKGTRYQVSALQHNKVIHTDVIDVANAKDRTRFVAGLRKKYRRLNAREIENGLLQLVDQVEAKAAAPVAPVEINVSAMIRPEQIIQPEFAAFSVPVFEDHGGERRGRWMLYIQWKDGRREARELQEALDVGGRQLYIDPMPSEPTMPGPGCSKEDGPGWSAASREQWLSGADAPNPAQLVKALCERFEHYLEFPPEHGAGMAAVLALWTVLTYVYLAWRAVPYVYVGGPVGSGKSTVFNVLSRVVFRPHTASSTTAAAMFRVLQAQGGTFLFDEAEQLKGKTAEAQSLLPLLLGGYKAGGVAHRTEGGNDREFKVVAFEVYGPKALACINGVPPALASRCIRMMMFRAAPGSPKPRRRVDARDPIWRGLRDDLHTLMLGNASEWLRLVDDYEAVEGFGNRDFELWQPLLALASWVESRGVPGLVDAVRNFATQTVADAQQDLLPEQDVLLLQELANGTSRPTPAELLTELKRSHPELFKYMNPATVSQKMRNYGLRTTKSNTRREFRPTRAELLAIQTRYGVALGLVDPKDVPNATTLAGNQNERES